MDKLAKVLVIDDQPGMRMLLKHALTDTGYLVETAPDGVHGLKIIGEVKPQAVLVDLKMPGMNGLDFVEQLHAKNFFPKVILMTACMEEETFTRAEKLGVTCCLFKPFNVTDLLQAMEQVAEQFAAGPAAGIPLAKQHID